MNKNEELKQVQVVIDCVRGTAVVFVSVVALRSTTSLGYRFRSFMISV